MNSEWDAGEDRLVKLSRTWVAALLSVVALAVPALDAWLVIRGGNTADWAGPFVWAAGAVPALLVALIGGWRARRRVAVSVLAVAVVCVALLAPPLILSFGSSG